MIIERKCGGGSGGGGPSFDGDLAGNTLRDSTGDTVIEHLTGSSVIARNSTGTPGSDQLNIYHDNIDGCVESKKGYMRLKGASHVELVAGGQIILQSDSGTAVLFKTLRPLANGQQMGNINWRFDYYGRELHLQPGSSVSPSEDNELVFEATNDTTLTVKYQGGDSVVRSTTLTLT